MGWEERLREAALTGPSGTRITFDFEDVSLEFDKKTAAFNFADADGTFVQDNGRTGRRYPLRVFFWGDDYDEAAKEFEAVLSERGTAKLEHPSYGSVDVVPFGTIGRRDDLKTASNQAIFEVTFWATIGLVYPTGQGDPAASVVVAVDEYNAAAAGEFADQTELDSTLEKTELKSKYQAILGATFTRLQDIAAVQADVQTQFDAIFTSINTGIDALVGDPLTLAFQTSLMIQAPARARASIQARLCAYESLGSGLIAGAPLVSTVNELRTNDLYVSSYITGSILSAVNNQFTTKTEAIQAAEAILLQFDNVVAWRDANFVALGAVDTGEAYQKLLDAVGIAVGFLVEISFSLKQERRFVLDRPRTYIDLVGELYGEVDSQIDFFITSNDLSGDEMFELPAGREIVFYV